MTVSIPSRRPLALGSLLALSTLLGLAGCSEPNCPKGYVKVGARCRPLADAGTPRDTERDGGPDSTPDATTTPGAECKREADCGNPNIFDCIDNTCAQTAACTADQPCGGNLECSAGTCVPFVPPERLPSGVVSTNGGGTARSSNYVLRLSIGTPQPMGNAKSTAYTLSAGPGAGQN